MRTLICPTSILDAARAFAARVPDGAGMFSRACGTVDADTGETAVTHYLSHYTVAVGHLAEMLPYKSWAQGEEGEWVSSETAGDPEELMAALGITEPDMQSTALALLEHLDISDQSAEAACARLGIVML